MEINDVVTLESGKKYLLLDKTNYNSEYYYLAGQVKDEKSPVEGEYVFLKNIKDSPEIIEIVTDDELKGNLIVMFAHQLEENVNNLEKNVNNK